MKRLSISDITARKSQAPLVVLTAYTAPMARMLDAHVDILLVGDSVGMVLYGMENTRGVTLDIMKAHGRAVVNASAQALVVIDMPFGTYETSPQQALESAKTLMEYTGAHAVKIEGGAEIKDTIRLLTQNNIPVMAHVGLMPQRVTERSGYATQGKTEDDAKRITDDAIALQEAGAFAVLMEGTTEVLARSITEKLRVPTIGIGASPACDGQVLVTDDMLGLSGGYVPRFVKPYAALASNVEDAVKKYADDVRARRFPSPEFCYPYKKD